MRDGVPAGLEGRVCDVLRRLRSWRSRLVVGPLAAGHGAGSAPTANGGVPPASTRVRPSRRSAATSWARSVCAAVAPIVGTIVLGREMTGARSSRSTLELSSSDRSDGCSPTGCSRPALRRGRRRTAARQPPHAAAAPRPQYQRSAAGANAISCPTKCCSNSAPAPRRSRLAQLASQLQLTLLETQTLRAHRPHAASASASRQPFGARDAARRWRAMRFVDRRAGESSLPACSSSRHRAAQRSRRRAICRVQAASPGSARVTNGDDVLVAVIDSQDRHAASRSRRRRSSAQYDVLGAAGAAACARHRHGRRHRRAWQIDRRRAESAPAGGARIFRRARKRAGHHLQHSQRPRLGGRQERAHRQYELCRARRSRCCATCWPRPMRAAWC